MEGEKDIYLKCPKCGLSFECTAQFCCVCEESLTRETDPDIIDHGKKAICGNCVSIIHDMHQETIKKKEFI